MIALLLAVSVTGVSGVTVTAPRNPDANLVSRNVLPDGTVGECRQVMDAKPGWLPFQCSTSPFLGQAEYQPIATRTEASWSDPQPVGAPNRSGTFVVWKSPASPAN